MVITIPDEIIEPEKEPDEIIELEKLEEIKDASIPISGREVDYLLNDMYDIISLYLLVGDKQIMDVSRNPFDYLNEIFSKLREFGVVE